MIFATIDCGTTNSRVYIVNEQARVLGKATKKVGVRDTAIQGNNEVLKQGLKDTLFQALANAGLALQDLEFVISSGMITSEIGLLEIPHLWAPTSLDELAGSLKHVHDRAVFPVDISVYFIRGIKNPYDPSTASLKDVGRLDFMRGEEAQVAGVLSQNLVQTPTTVVFLSSHTKFVPVDADRRILGSLTTLSGQVYAAILKETSIGKSLKKDDDVDDDSYFDKEIVNLAASCVDTGGFLRTMLMPRFLDVLLPSTWYERKLFVEAAIAAEDMATLRQFTPLDFPLDTSFLLIGSSRRCRIYQHLLQHQANIQGDIHSITDPRDIDMLSIRGALELAKIAGLVTI